MAGETWKDMMSITQCIHQITLLTAFRIRSLAACICATGWHTRTNLFEGNSNLNEEIFLLFHTTTLYDIETLALRFKAVRRL